MLLSRIEMDVGGSSLSSSSHLFFTSRYFELVLSFPPLLVSCLNPSPPIFQPCLLLSPTPTSTGRYFGNSGSRCVVLELSHFSCLRRELTSFPSSSPSSLVLNAPQLFSATFARSYTPSPPLARKLGLCGL